MNPNGRPCPAWLRRRAKTHRKCPDCRGPLVRAVKYDRDVRPDKAYFCYPCHTIYNFKR